VALLEEAIGLYEETLRQRPVGHERRAESLNDLGDTLYYFCSRHEADGTRASRCIELLREGLSLRPPGHQLRDQSLHNLARSLRDVLYHKLGRLDILMECASLNREALRLRPPGHSERSNSMNNLAIDLMVIVQHTGDMEMRAEMIRLHRESLWMCPPGHPEHHISLNNLGIALRNSFEDSGGSDVLAECISVMREVLTLRPIGHPRRFLALDTLASALSLRFYHEGHSESFPEAITLEREALQLLSDSHPARAMIKSNLAAMLLVNVRVGADGSMLAEAIRLLRQAVAFHTIGSHSHDTALQNLAEALEAKFDKDGDTEALLEAASLHRETLNIRVIGNIMRFQSLEGLARVLCKSGSRPWPEAFSRYQEALQLCPVGYPARSRLLSGVSRCFLDISSPFFSLSEGISCLSEAYADTYSHVSGRLQSAIPDLQQLELAYGALTGGPHLKAHSKDAEQVLDLYMQIIGLLPLAANFGLEHSARLQALKGYDVIARDAAARAVLLGLHSQAVQILEEGRGVFWMQTLHLRATAFDGVPEADNQELQRMFRVLEHGARRAEVQDQSTVRHERESEERRQLNEAVQALISKIRRYPGLDRFLLPPAFDALLASLPDGFVAIVNASKLGYHALLLHRTLGFANSLELKPFVAGFDCATLIAQLPRDIVPGSEHDDEVETRAMRVNKGKLVELEDVLSVLWTSIVQPVVDTLGLHVSSRLIVSYAVSDRIVSASTRTRSAATLVVCDGRTWVSAYSCRWEVSRCKLCVHRGLFRLVIYSHACLAHQGETSLDTYCSPRLGWASRL
jgi:tetratricopeptide (TPR) repeat protein